MNLFVDIAHERLAEERGAFAMGIVAGIQSAFTGKTDAIKALMKRRNADGPFMASLRDKIKAAVNFVAPEKRTRSRQS